MPASRDKMNDLTDVTVRVTVEGAREVRAAAAYDRYVLDAVAEGLKDIERGDVVSNDDVWAEWDREKADLLGKARGS